MIEPCAGLSAEVLDEIAALEARVLAVDGGRLKLEWATLRARPSGVVNDVLVRVDGQLVGFVGVYRHGGKPEITGMIDPDHRRAGLGAAALAAALRLVPDSPVALLVVPRASTGGRRLALARGGVLDHAEYALVQRAAPHTPEPATLDLRPATKADRAVVGRLMKLGFGDRDGVDQRLRDTVVAEFDGAPIAALMVARQDDGAGVYGFVVEPELRGRGIGRAVLGRVCRDLRASGVREVRLEVEVDNEHALGLYTSLGFEPVTTEDYYRLSTPGHRHPKGSGREREADTMSDPWPTLIA